MSSGYVMEVDLTTACLFPDCSSLDGGSLYIVGIDFGDVIVRARGCALPPNFSDDKKIVDGDIWESNIEYRYELDEDDGVNWVIHISGEMAVEFDDGHGLTRDVDSLDICEVAVGWAANGESQRTICEEPGLEECDLRSIKFVEDFSGYP